MGGWVLIDVDNFDLAVAISHLLFLCVFFLLWIWVSGCEEKRRGNVTFNTLDGCGMACRIQDG